MKCLILAAGRGSRLSNKGQPKPLVPFLGLTLIERAIMTANACGINEFFVVTGYQGQKVRDFLDKVKRERNLVISCIKNDQWDLENGVSVLKAKDILREPFLLMMCDHVISPEAVKNLVKQVVEKDQVLVSVDYNLETHPDDTIEEATKVLVQEGKILDIGKKLPHFNALDCGLFVCTPAIFSAIERSIEQGDSTLSGAIKVLASKGMATAHDLGKRYWFDIDDEESYAKAEHGVLKSLYKNTDGPISRFLNRPISTRITRKIINKDLAPNTISFFSFLITLLSACCLAFNSYWFLLMGGLLAQLASIIDGCDGEVARLKFLSSKFGAWLDAVLDRYSDAALISGLTFHSLYSGNVFFNCAAGLLALTGAFINSYTAEKYDKYMMNMLRNKANVFRVGRDVRIFTIFLGALLNKPLLALLILGIGMNLENIRRIFLLSSVKENEEFI